jgi:putative MATE family efflux protein
MKDLSTGNEGRLIWKFAIPMLFGNVFQQMYSVVDSMIVGRYLGKEALAAIGTSMPISFLLVSFFIGITMGFTIIVSQYFGAKDMARVKRAINTLYIFIFFCSLLMSVVGILLSEWIFRLIGLNEEVIPQAVIFLNIFMGGLVFLFGYNGTSAILRGLGDSKTPLYFLIGSVILNVILDIIFIPVLGWGVWSAAFATVLSEAVAFIAQIIYLNHYHKVIRFSFKDLAFDREIFNKGIKIGLPTGLQQTFVAAGMVALYGIVNRFGVDANAAYSAAGRIDNFAAMPAMSFSMALSTFVGQNLGANKPQRVANGLRATLAMTAVISLFVTLITVIFGKYIMMLFSKDAEVIELGSGYLLVIGSSYILFSTMFVMNGVLRGAGDTLVPMFITLFALWIIRIPVAYFLSSYPSIGIYGVYWSIPAGWLFGAGLSFIYFMTGRWKKKSVVKYSADGKRTD